MDSLAELEAAQERASREELGRLSLLSTDELIQRIEQGRFGERLQAFAALATKKDDRRLTIPFLAAQLDRLHSVTVRHHCASALLSLLPYKGIPSYALADRSHRGNTIYREDLAALIETTLKRLESSSAQGQ